MARELMVALSIVAFVSGLLGALGFTILNFRGGRLAKFVGVVAVVATVVCWGLGLFPPVPFPYVWASALLAASAYVGTKAQDAWENFHAFIERRARHWKA